MNDVNVFMEKSLLNQFDPIFLQIIHYIINYSLHNPFTAAHCRQNITHYKQKQAIKNK
ncbi:hypothetical protein COTS27_00574 [Spirochaetota bacterium]|nr:hypothetical protein COTS27_00574 [Spirochaetota bacterium]